MYKINNLVSNHNSGINLKETLKKIPSDTNEIISFTSSLPSSSFFSSSISFFNVSISALVSFSLFFSQLIARKEIKTKSTIKKINNLNFILNFLFT